MGFPEPFYKDPDPANCRDLDHSNNPIESNQHAVYENSVERIFEHLASTFRNTPVFEMFDLNFASGNTFLRDVYRVLVTVMRPGGEVDMKSAIAIVEAQSGPKFTEISYPSTQIYDLDIYDLFNNFGFATILEFAKTGIRVSDDGRFFLRKSSLNGGA